MSLLLDALKKAAEDKKKASNNDGGSVNVSTDAVDEGNVVSEAVESFSLEEIQSSEAVIDAEKAADKLTLDVGQVTTTTESAKSIENGPDLKAASTNSTSGNGASVSGAGVNEARHTVSDDALSLLIYKTNSEEKKRKRIFAIGTTVVALLVVGVGGAYYYLNMQENINSIELKHRTAMMRMEAKTNRQRPPEKIEIIDNLTANSDIKIVKKKILIEVDEVVAEPKQKKKIRSTGKRAFAQNKARLLLIEKTNQSDKVGKKLEAAWGAYDNGSYAEAKNLYNDVVLNEKNNRDALLGLGAIAVIEKNVAAAKKHYRALLRLDPNDPLAVAALSSLRSNESSPEISEKYLVSMLEKTPEAAQLNFELGNVYAQQDNWSAAQQSYFKAWQQESENPDYIFNLAVSLDQLGQQQQAMNFYQDSLLKAKNKQVSFSRETVEQRVTELSGL